MVHGYSVLAAPSIFFRPEGHFRATPKKGESLKYLKKSPPWKDGSHRAISNSWCSRLKLLQRLVLEIYIFT